MTEQTKVEDKTQLISLAKASSLYGFNQAYLATLARKGRLKAIKPGNEWLTTVTDVEDFIRSRKRIGIYRDDIQVDGGAS
jgi:hypothetical protein